MGRPAYMYIVLAKTIPIDGKLDWKHFAMQSRFITAERATALQTLFRVSPSKLRAAGLPSRAITPKAYPDSRVTCRERTVDFPVKLAWVGHTTAHVTNLESSFRDAFLRPFISTCFELFCCPVTRLTQLPITYNPLPPSAGEQWETPPPNSMRVPTNGRRKFPVCPLFAVVGGQKWQRTSFSGRRTCFHWASGYVHVGSRLTVGGKNQVADRRSFAGSSGIDTIEH